MTELKDETIELGPIREGHPRVEVGLGFTKNIGGYESLRVDIRWSDLVEDDETHEEATDRVYDRVEAKLVEKVEAIDKELGPKRAKESNIHGKNRG